LRAMVPNNKEYKRYVFVVSDATGKTCQTVVKAALTQFKTKQVVLETHSNIRSLEKIQEIIQRAARINGVVVFTMVSTELRTKVTELGRLNAVPTVDILGPTLMRFSDLFEISPLAQPGLFRQLDSAYFKRIEAVDFTIKHDDGAGLSTLDKAEIILVGVSRTAKTPVSIYLAYRGCKVANVPVILDQEPPRELKRVKQKRIIALTVKPERLQLIRLERERKFKHNALDEYIDPVQIQREVTYGLRIYKERGWPILDVTYKAIEETATDVLRIID